MEAVIEQPPKRIKLGTDKVLPKCQVCGKETKWFTSSGKPKRWCSARCRGRDSNVQKSRTQYIHRCVDCGEVWRSTARGTQRCRACSNIAVSKALTKNHQYPYEETHGEAECPACGKKFKRKWGPQSRGFESRPQLFCSRQCMHNGGVFRRQSDEALTRTRMRLGSERLHIIIKRMCKMCGDKFVMWMGE